MKLSTNKKLQAGFMNALIMFGIALVVAMMAAWAIANRSSNTNATTEQTKMNASVVLKQASDLKDGFTRALADGIYAQNILFDTSAFVPATGLGGLFNTNKYVSQQTPPLKAMDSSGTAANFLWTYHKLASIPNVGMGGPHYIASIGPLTQDVCERINAMMYNSTAQTVQYGAALDKYIPAAANTLVGLTTIPAAAALGVGATVDAPDMSGKTDLCVQTTDFKYVYYKVMVEN